jgi:predicted nucleotidyltransferase
MNPRKIEIINELKSKLLDRFPENLNEVILFGSQLSDQFTTESDFDILIVVKGVRDWKLEREISDICYDIELKHNIITDTHVLSESELNSPRGRQPIYLNAINLGYHA